MTDVEQEGRLEGLLVAVVTAEGADAIELEALRRALRRHGARVQLVAPLTEGGGMTFHLDDGQVMQADARLDRVSAGYWDAAVVGPGEGAIRTLCADEGTDRLLRSMVKLRRAVGAYRSSDVLDLVGLLGDGRCELEEPTEGTAVGAEEMMRGRDASAWSEMVVTSEEDEDVDAFVDRFAEVAAGLRARQLVDERSLQSFPASDSAAGASI